METDFKFSTANRPREGRGQVTREPYKFWCTAPTIFGTADRLRAVDLGERSVL